LFWGGFGSNILFSIRPTKGFSTRKMLKYNSDAPCPIMIYGCSTGMPPIHVSTNMSATKIQNKIWESGRKVRLRCFDVWNSGTIISTRIDDNSARTPTKFVGD